MDREDIEFFCCNEAGKVSEEKEDKLFFFK